jgi:predicted nuclease of predicted toxin-antitoxin system
MNIGSQLLKALLISMLKIYLNENLSWKIAKALREYGYDAISSLEVDMNEADDNAQFEYAISQGRAIVTNNFRDFVELYNQYASKGKSHYGIIFTTRCTIPTIIKRLKKLLKTVPTKQTENKIIWLNDFE